MNGPSNHLVGNADQRITVGTAWAWDLRLKGYSIRKIADESLAGLGYSIGKSTVMNWLDAHAKELNAESLGKAAEYKRIQIEKLDLQEAEISAMMASLRIPRDIELALKCQDRRLAIAARRARLEGMDAATEVSVDGVVTYQIVGLSPDELT